MPPNTDVPARRYVGRGGEKLEAAIATFQLKDIVAGAVAIDLGASTGGFTQCLLRHGAAKVVAVDVGSAQLHPILAADPRVESHERTDFKRLSLGQLPGPFDFFSVDVSFVAARNMLRSLAFRLRPGAQGVVLIKPQFELAERFIAPGGKVDEEHGKRALERFRKKAATLNFEIDSCIASPVATDSGTVELLAHLRFVGRPAALPNKRGPTDERAHGSAPAQMGQPATRYDLFAVAAPGLESLVLAEVERLAEVENVRLVDGGVEFSGSKSVLYRAHLWLRIATRVLVRVGSFHAAHFSTFRRRAAKLSWHPFIGNAAIKVSSSVSHCRLYHTGALAENLELAVSAQKVRQAGKAEPPAETEQRLFVRGTDDQFVISIDASGELLHKRGWRIEAGPAPLRETHAAALLAICGWDPTKPLVDLMCGSGTIVIEAAGLALGQPPGLHRSFAFFDWPSFDRSLWETLREEALAMERAQKTRARSPQNPVAAELIGYDADADVIERARRNAQRAGVENWVQFLPASLTDPSTAPPRPGLVLCNPPFGKRMGSQKATKQLLESLVVKLRRDFAGWKAALLVPAPLLPRIRLPTKRKTPLSSGGLRLVLVELDLPARTYLAP